MSAATTMKSPAYTQDASATAAPSITLKCEWPECKSDAYYEIEKDYKWMNPVRIKLCAAHTLTLLERRAVIVRVHHWEKERLQK